MVDPLKLDPSRTSLLRHSMQREMEKKLQALQDEIIEAWQASTSNSISKNSPRELEQFRAWLKGRVDDVLLSPMPFPPLPTSPLPQHPLHDPWPWLAVFLMMAYREGALRAWHETQAQPYPAIEGSPGAGQGGSRWVYLGVLMRQQEENGELHALITRAQESLKAIAAHLTSSLVSLRTKPHSDPTEIETIIKTTLTRRLEPLISGEIVAASSEGFLTGAKILGVKHVSGLAEWETGGNELKLNTMKDMKVCPKCKKMEGKRFTIEQARGILPLHPRCRCYFSIAR